MLKVRLCSTVPVVHSRMGVNMETVGVLVLAPGKCPECLLYEVDCATQEKTLGKDCGPGTIFKLVPMEELCQS